MTVIAYSNGTLCSDSRLSSGDVILSDQYEKVGKNDKGWIAGAAGTASNCQIFWEWFYSNPKMNTWVDVPVLDSSDYEFRAIVVNKKRVIHDLAPKSVIVTPADFCTHGSGWRFAMAIITNGGTAREAVETAIKCCSSCGGEVQEVSL